MQVKAIIEIRPLSDKLELKWPWHHDANHLLQFGGGY